jgi:hypothetical protein
VFVLRLHCLITEIKLFLLFDLGFRFSLMKRFLGAPLEKCQECLSRVMTLIKVQALAAQTTRSNFKLLKGK